MRDSHAYLSMAYLVNVMTIFVDKSTPNFNENNLIPSLISNIPFAQFLISSTVFIGLLATCRGIKLNDLERYSSIGVFILLSAVYFHDVAVSVGVINF